MLGIFLVALAACSSPAASAPKPVDKFKLSLSSYAAVYAPFLVAIDKGYFAAQGLDVEIVLAGGGLAVPALLSGEIPYTASAASSMGAIIKGAPLKVVYTNADRSVQQLWAAPEVKTLDDLKGKTIGVSNRGDSNELTVRMLLEQQHVDQSTIGYTALGASGNAVAALVSGAVPAAVVGGGFVAQMQKSGFKGGMLYDLSKVQLLYNGLATTDKELQDHRDRAKKLLYATMQGRDYFRAFQDQTIQILAGYAKQAPEDMVQDYDTTLVAMTEDGTMPVEAQKQDTAVRAAILQMPPSDVPPVERMYDYSLVKQAYQELKASGWKPSK
ncbi:MAG: ABC transporter substrate-binding protein [Chloroflexota bacterium]